jgi:hypothetical protein
MPHRRRSLRAPLAAPWGYIANGGLGGMKAALQLAPSRKRGIEAELLKQPLLFLWLSRNLFDPLFSFSFCFRPCIEGREIVQFQMVGLTSVLIELSNVKPMRK